VTASEEENTTPGESKEQQRAEAWLIQREAERIGANLVKKRLSCGDGSWLELDGFCDSPSVLCEAWAHVGSPKSAQKNKVMSDAFKLAFAGTLIQRPCRNILIFGDGDAASHFRGKSWMAECLKRNNITIEVIDFPPDLKSAVLSAQKRQYR
jgi:hypothetical protein